METAIRRSYAADVTGALEKLKQGNSDESRSRNRNTKKAEDHVIRRSLSPGLCRSYDWNTTHFYPDIHQIEGPNVFVSTHRGMGRTVRFASERESSDEEREELKDKEELEEDEEERGEKEERRRGKTKEVEMGDEHHKEEESEEFASSLDDFDEWNPSSENENEADRNAEKGCRLKVEATPVVQNRTEDTQGRRYQRRLSPAGDGAPSAYLGTFGVGESKGEKLDRSRLPTEPRHSALDTDQRGLDDWENNEDESKWIWERGRAEHQLKNTVYANEEMPPYDWKQSEFFDAKTLVSKPSMESATQLCHSGKSEQSASKSERSDDLQKKKETVLKRVIARETVIKDDSPSPTSERERPRQQPNKPHKCITMITHFDDPWPVSEFGSEYADRRKDLATEASLQLRGQCSPEGKSIRSILKHNRVPDEATNSIKDPFNGSDLSKPHLEDPIQAQWSTLPNMHRFVGISASCSAAVDDADEARDHEAWRATGDSNTDAQEKRWKSESFLFLEDARSRSQDGKQKRFVIDYRRPSRGHVTFAGSGERRTIGPFTLNEFERCLEIPAGQLELKETTEAVKEEVNRSPKMEESRTERQANRLRMEETINGKDDLSSKSDPSSDLFWLFHRANKSDCHSWKGPKNEYTGFLSQNRSMATTATLHPADWEKSAYETSKYPDNNRKVDPRWKTGPAVGLRQQYRWSTAIREPHASVLLDQWNADPPLSLIPPRNRYKIVQPEHLLTKYQTTDVDSIRPNNFASTNERAFTITGQPKAHSPLKNHSNARQPTKNYAVVGISRQDRSTVPPVRGSTDWQNERPSAISEDSTRSPINQKHRYLRERVLTESSVDSNPELTDPTPADPNLFSRLDIAYHSLQNLEQLQLTNGASKRKPIYHETWDSYTSRSSLLSLPSNLLRQWNVDIPSVGSQDSVEKTSEVRKTRGQRIQGRRGNACAVVSFMRNSSPSQTQDASGEESTSDRSLSERTKSKENRGLRQFEVSAETEKTPAAQDHRPKYLRTTRKVQQTPRTVKARHEMKARRGRGTDRGKEITPIANWNRHSYGPSYSNESFNPIRR